jgi:uncharacterized damage-inducible protein DinB
MSVETIRGLYDYHRWANHRLFDVAAGLGEEAATREVGAQFSAPTLLRMFGHLYGADFVWLQRWNGTSPTALPGAQFPSLGALRERWDELEREQRTFVEALGAADLERVIDYKNTEGKPFRMPLGPLLQHVTFHGAHHRSEIATMITMISASPPDTGMLTYHLTCSGQLK